MSFFTKLQNIFGFGPDDDEVYEGMGNNEHEVGNAPNEPSALNDPTTSGADVPIVASNDMVLMIFDKVVEVTNACVPDYFASSLDTEKQKRYLFNALDESVRQYIIALEAKAQDKCMALWKGERDNLQREMDTQRQRARELEARRAEINEQKLSAERQRRALSERVRDLESDIMKLEAEKEQLEIEKHSLINKAKVANVYEADLESMRQQIAELKNNPPDEAVVKENEQLRAQIDSLNSHIDSLNSRIEELNKDVEAANVKSEMSGAMFSDMQKHNAEAIKQTQDLTSQIEQLQKDVAVRDAQISDLKQQIEDRDARIAEDQETIEAIEQIAEQIDLFEGVKAKLDERIVNLKGDLKKLQLENDTLRLTIKNNIYTHAQQEKALKDQIDQLMSQRT